MPNPSHRPWPAADAERLKWRWLAEKALGYRSAQDTLELLAAEFGRSVEGVRGKLEAMGLYVPASCRRAKRTAEPKSWKCLRCRAGAEWIDRRRWKCLRCGAGREWLDKRE